MPYFAARLQVRKSQVVYDQEPRIQLREMTANHLQSLEVGDFSISHAIEVAPGGHLSALKDAVYYTIFRREIASGEIKTRRTASRLT